MFRTIIVDDEQHCIDAILNLTEVFPGVFNVVGTFTSVEEGVEATKKLAPNLVFLDVEIHGKTGFDYLKEVKNMQFKVVFTTAYNKYAVKAFKFSAFDYLLKPVVMDDFEQTVAKLKKESSFKNLEEKMDVLMYNLTVNDSEKRITVNTATDLYVVKISEILYCKSIVNYTALFTQRHGEIISSKTLKSYEALLSGSGFYRVDQSYLINLANVKKYTKGKPAYAIMDDNTKIKVSLNNKEGFLNALNNLYRE